MIVVIGGGVAGLVAAREVTLALPGESVLVLEAGDRVGGKLRREEVAGHAVDVGAESILGLRPEAADLIADIGAADLLVTPATTAASIWTRGGLHPLPKATLMGIPSDPEAAAGILTAAEIERARDERPWPAGPVTEDVSVGDYVEARLGAAVVDRLVEPLLGGVYAGHARELSLQATMPQVWAKAVRGESIVPASAGPGGASGASGMASRRPPFIGLHGGVGRLPELLAGLLRERGVTIRTKAIVRQLRRTPTGYEVVVGPTIAPVVIPADAVIIATPPTAAGRLLATLAPDCAGALGEIATASSAVVTLAVRRAELGQVPGSGFLVPPVDHRLVKASTFSFVKWAWSNDLDPDIVHLRGSVGRAGEEADLQREDTELVAAVAADIGAAIGRPLPTVVDSHVQRWGGGLPQYTVGHVDRIRRAREGVAMLPGVRLAGAAYEGVGIPAVIKSARLAAADIIDYRRTESTHATEGPA